jgi:hypothetical protein
MPISISWMVMLERKTIVVVTLAAQAMTLALARPDGAFRSSETTLVSSRYIKRDQPADTVQPPEVAAQIRYQPFPSFRANRRYFRRKLTDGDSLGNTYISDGYINSRVAKIAPDGRWLGSWGSFGSAPGEFNTLHSIQVDARDQIYVADRGNRRIQVFDTDGKLLRIIQIDVPAPADAPVAIGNRPVVPPAGPDTAANKTMMPGAPWALCITPRGRDGQQVLYVADAWPGRIYKLSLDGKVLGWLGGSGKQLKQFGWVHEIACPTENELYVGELLNWRLQKLTLHP